MQLSSGYFQCLLQCTVPKTYSKAILIHPKPLVLVMNNAPEAFASVIFCPCGLFPLSNVPAVSYPPHPLDFLDSTLQRASPGELSNPTPKLPQQNALPFISPALL